MALASSSSVRFVNVESSNRVLVRVGLSASVSESMCAIPCARVRVRESMCVCARAGVCVCVILSASVYP